MKVFSKEVLQANTVARELGISGVSHGHWPLIKAVEKLVICREMLYIEHNKPKTGGIHMLTTKRIYTLVLALILALSLVACGDAPKTDIDQGKNNNSSNPVASAPSTPVDKTEPQSAETKPTEPQPTETKPVDPVPTTSAAPANPIYTLSDKEVLETVNYDTVTVRGFCGDDLRWAYDKGILTITGTGKMYEYGRNKNLSPWREEMIDPIRVVIGDGVTSIGKCAFWQIETLEIVGVADSVTNISSGAFEKCSALKSFSMEGAAEIGDQVFLKCTSLEAVHIGGTLTKLPVSFCADCPNLKTVTLSDSIEIISGNAFDNCASLSSINMPNHLKEIESSAFADCTSLETVHLPEGFTHLWVGAFYGCTSLKEISLPDTLASIETEAFAYCTSLRAVNIPLNTNWSDDAFKFSGLESFTMDDNDPQPFMEGCTDLKTFRFSIATTEITNPHLIFEGCTGLQEIYLPAGLEYDASMLLAYCPDAKVITF